MMWKSPGIAAALIAACAGMATGRADDPAVAAAYGRGVHAYYAGSFQQSHDALSRVVNLKTSDPRVYYFRGLAALQLGRRDEAIADFSEGADLETAGWSSRTVSLSLERVQGPDRLLLERSRMRARLAIARRGRPGGRAAGMSSIDLGGQRFSGIGGDPAAAASEAILPAPKNPKAAVPEPTAAPAEPDPSAADEKPTAEDDTLFGDDL